MRGDEMVECTGPRRSRYNPQVTHRSGESSGLQELQIRGKGAYVSKRCSGRTQTAGDGRSTRPCMRDLGCYEWGLRAPGKCDLCTQGISGSQGGHPKDCRPLGYKNPSSGTCPQNHHPPPTHIPTIHILLDSHPNNPHRNNVFQ